MSRAKANAVNVSIASNASNANNASSAIAVDNAIADNAAKTATVTQGKKATALAKNAKNTAITALSAATLPDADSLAALIGIKRQYQKSVRLDSDIHDSHALDGYIPIFSALKMLNTMCRSIMAQKNCAFTWSGAFGSGKSTLALLLAALCSANEPLRAQAYALIKDFKDSDGSNLIVELFCPDLMAANVNVPVATNITTTTAFTTTTAAVSNIATAATAVTAAATDSIAPEDNGLGVPDDSQEAFGPQPWQALCLVGSAASLRYLVQQQALQFMAAMAATVGADAGAATTTANTTKAKAKSKQSKPKPKADALAPSQFLNTWVKSLQKHGKHVLLIIDELGKFLTNALQDHDIYFLQELAEAAARSAGHLVVLGIMHQSFDAYIAGFNKQVREEWVKVQGRFDNAILAPSIFEILKIISNSFDNHGYHHELKVAPYTELFFSQSQSFYPEINEAFSRCLPLHPLVVILLCSLSKKSYGQNERSIFGFLTSFESFSFASFLLSHAVSSQELYLPEHLFDYILNNQNMLMAQSKDGHLYMEIMEVFARLEKSATAAQIALYKTICMIELLGKDYAIYASKDLLALLYEQIVFNLKQQQRFHTHAGDSANAGDTANTDDADIENTANAPSMETIESFDNALEQLVQQKAVLFKSYLNAYGCFIGSDFDFEGEYAKAQAQVMVDFSLLKGFFVESQTVVAKRYYLQTGTLRYLEVDLLTESQVQSELSTVACANDAMGKIFLVFLEEDQELLSSLMRLKAKSYGRKNVVFALDLHSQELMAMCRSLQALRQMALLPALEGDSAARKEVGIRVKDLEKRLQERVHTSLSSALFIYDGAIKNVSYILTTAQEQEIQAQLQLLTQFDADNTENKAETGAKAGAGAGATNTANTANTATNAAGNVANATNGTNAAEAADNVRDRYENGSDASIGADSSQNQAQAKATNKSKNVKAEADAEANAKAKAKRKNKAKGNDIYALYSEAYRYWDTIIDPQEATTLAVNSTAAGDDCGDDGNGSDRGKRSSSQVILEDYLRTKAMVAQLSSSGSSTADAATPVVIKPFDLCAFASVLAEQLFPKAVHVHNELINRNKLSSQASKAKNQLMQHMVSHQHEAKLGFSGTPPEVNLYWTLLYHNKLHRSVAVANAADNAPDRGNAIVSAASVTTNAAQASNGNNAGNNAGDSESITATVATTATPEQPEQFTFVYDEQINKRFLQLFEDTLEFMKTRGEVTAEVIYDFWAKPPYGLKKGICQILLLYLILVKQEEIATYDKGTFVTEYDGSFVDELQVYHDSVTLKYVSGDPSAQSLLQHINTALEAANCSLSSEQPLKPLLVARQLVRFVLTLPSLTQKTSKLSLRTMRLRSTVNAASDPIDLLFTKLPEIYPDLSQSAQTLSTDIAELLSFYDKTLSEIEALLFKSLQFDPQHGIEELRQRALNIKELGKGSRQEQFITKLANYNEGLSGIEGIVTLCSEHPRKDWKDQDISITQALIPELAMEFRKTESFAGLHGRDAKRSLFCVTTSTPEMDDIREVIELSEQALKNVIVFAQNIKSQLAQLPYEQVLGVLAQLAALLKPPTLEPQLPKESAELTESDQPQEPEKTDEPKESEETEESEESEESETQTQTQASAQAQTCAESQPPDKE